MFRLLNSAVSLGLSTCLNGRPTDQTVFDRCQLDDTAEFGSPWLMELGRFVVATLLFMGFLLSGAGFTSPISLAHLESGDSENIKNKTGGDHYGKRNYDGA